MLTPQDVKNKEFTKALFGGYDMAAVDDFLEILMEDYSSLYKENAILKNKLKVLVEKVEEYRSTEDAMRMALLTAQKMSKEIVDEATSKSRDMVEEAETAARNKIDELRIELKKEELRLEAARKATADFVSASDEVCKRHIDFLSNIGKLIIKMEKEKEPEPPKEEKPPNQVEQLSETAKTIEDSVAKIYENKIRSDDTENDSRQDDFIDIEESEFGDVKGNMQEDEFDGDAKVFTPVNDKASKNEKAEERFNIRNLQFGSNYEHKK